MRPDDQERKDRIAYKERMITRSREWIRRGPAPLRDLEFHAFDLAALRHADGAPPDDVIGMLRLAAHAGAAAYDAAARPGPLRVLLGDEVVDIPDVPDPDGVDSTMWMRGFLCGALARETAALDRLCAAPPSLWRNPGATAPEYGFQMLALLADLHTTRDVDADKVVEAMENTDPARLEESDVDMALALDSPVLELLWRIARRNSEGFDESLAKALGHHETYWETLAEWRDEGWMAWRLAGVAAIATDLGMDVHADSPWFPSALVRRG